MMRARLLDLSDRWFRLLQRLYPPDFRDDMATAVVETYRDRAREALDRGGLMRLAAVWMRALLDSIRNGPGERAHPAVSWRRSGDWGRDAELATRRLLRKPALVVAMVGTRSVGLGLFAVVYTVVQKVLIEPLPYKDPDDLYFVWRDYRAYFDLGRGWLGGTDVAELRRLVEEQSLRIQELERRLGAGASGGMQAESPLERQVDEFLARNQEGPVRWSEVAAGGSTFRLYGFLRLDAIYDDSRPNNTQTIAWIPRAGPSARIVPSAFAGDGLSSDPYSNSSL